MATKKQDPWTTNKVAIPKKAHKATSELAPVRKPTENSQIVGVFQSAKIQTINDINTKLPKDIMVYNFREQGTGARFAVLGGRTGMDAAFDTLFMEMGGAEKLAGMVVCIERGEDLARGEGKAGSIGTYNVYAWNEGDV
jgi:hypothetical protein